MSRLVRRLFSRLAPAPRPVRVVRSRIDLRVRLLLQPLEGRIAPATLTVSTNADDGAGSLRQAIVAANGAAGADTITFSSLFNTPQTIVLETVLPTISDTVTISGPGASLLNVSRDPGAGTLFRVFGLAAQATLSGLTISNGRTPASFAPNWGGGGVAVLSAQPVSILNSVVTGNTSAGPGGGIYVSAGGSLTVRNSTVSGNTAGANAVASYPPAGGGIYFHNGGSLLLEDSTVSGNVASPSSFTPIQGGGLYLYGSTAFTGNFVIRNSTISGNSATTAGGGVIFSTTGANAANSLLIQNSTIVGNSAGSSGGGLRRLGSSGGGSVNIVSTIIANNTAAAGADVSGSMTASFSLIRDRSGSVLTDAGNNLPPGTDPLLDPAGLAANGGPTRTVALQSGSPAADHGSNPALLGTDQRGMPRSFGQTDIGAYEAVPPGTPSATASPTAVTAAGGTLYSFQVTYTDDTAINVATLDSNDVRVTGPNGFNVLATFAGVDVASNGTPRVATYSFVPPGGSWDPGDNGAYTVSQEPSQVADTSGNFAPAGTLGAIQVITPKMLVVTNANDSGAGSLRQAILDANAAVGTSDFISFDPTFFGTPRTIALTSGELLITDSVTLTGPGVNLLTVQRAANAAQFRVFEVNGPNVIAVTMSGMTVTGGSTSGASGQGPRGDGAGILVANENLTLLNVAVVNNTSATEGGGIALGTDGTLTIRNSTISGNTANGPITAASGYLYGGSGGGIYFAEGGSLLLENSTVSGNSANNGGGGVYFFGTVSGGGLTIRNSTISGNTAATDGGGVDLSQASGTLLVQNSTITGNTARETSTFPEGGGGIALSNSISADITVISSIVSGNTATDGADIASYATVNVNYSAIGVSDGFTLSDASGQNLPFSIALSLQPLADNGGPTQTIALGAGSPAIDAGINPAGVTTDQRSAGFARVGGSAADIGAFEVQTGPPPVAPTVTGTAINGGAQQRSVVTDLTVTFSTVVTFAGPVASAFQLQRTGGAGPVTIGTATASTASGVTVVTLTGFAGADTIGGVTGSSLADGKYTLTALASQIAGAAGLPLDGNGDGTGGDNYTLADSGLAGGLYRLYGDANGDRLVNGADLSQFLAAFGAPNATFDSNFDGVVNGADLSPFIANFGRGIA